MASAPQNTSRIASESTRRVVIAVLMIAALAVATGLAAALTATSQGYRTPDLIAETFDQFRFERPAEWDEELVQTDAEGRALRMNVLTEGGGFRRQMTVFELKSQQPVEPARLAGDVARRLGMDPADLRERRDVRRFGPVLVSVHQAHFIDADDDLRHRVSAIATVDGRRHLILDLTGSTYAAELNRALMERLMPSVADTRFEVVTEPTVIDGALYTPTPRLIAMRRTDDPDAEKLVFVPAQAQVFCLLQALPLDVTRPFDLTNARIAGASEEIVAVPADMLEGLDPANQSTPRLRMYSALIWRYWRATDVLPTAQHVNRILLDEERILWELNLNTARRLPTFRALYGLLLNARRAVLIEAVSEYAGVREAQLGARLIGLALSAPEDAPGAVSSAEPVPEPEAAPNPSAAE